MLNTFSGIFIVPINLLFDEKEDTPIKRKPLGSTNSPEKSHPPKA